MDKNINKLKVSVIIPTWNRADFISTAIESVLPQTFMDFELLILDDGSTDNTEERVKKFLSDTRVKYIKHPQNLGITKNRNFGLKEARGEYIAMLDSDDVWLTKDKLQKQIEFLETHKEYGLIGTYAKKINADGKITAWSRPREIVSNLFLFSGDFMMRQNFLIRNQIFQSSVMIRKEALDQCGTYDEKISIWEDYELWLRLGLKWKFANIPEFLTGYRTHQKNISTVDKKRGLESTLQIIVRYKDKYPNYYLGYLKYFLKKNIKNL